MEAIETWAEPIIDLVMKSYKQKGSTIKQASVWRNKVVKLYVDLSD